MDSQPSDLTIHDLLRFNRLLQDMQSVIRQVRLAGRVAKENDVEHSYHLAMMAWYVSSRLGLTLKLELLLLYALVHDLAEVYAGDYAVLDHIGRMGKAERETAARQRIAAEFPEFSELSAIMEEYEARDSLESKFIYALDKLMPMLVIYQEGGSTWRELDYGLGELMANKYKTTARSPSITELAVQLEALLREHPGFFPRP